MANPVEDKNGLINKYIIRKPNGEPVDPSAEYFVLRLDKHQKDKCHANACTKAVLVYASEIKKQFPELAKDLQQRYGTDNWHVKGEFPPVGTVCEVLPYWHVCESIAPHQNGMVMYDRNNDEYFLATKNTRFRPIQTERDRLIDEAISVASVTYGIKETVERLADAGMLKMPEDK